MAKKRYPVLAGFNVPAPNDPVGRRWEPGQTLTEGQIPAGDLKQLIAAGALGKPAAEPAVVEPEDEEDEDG
jgi:hypothetical protein